MSAATYGERVVMAMSEAGYPPDEHLVVLGVRKARWNTIPPVEVINRARRICGRPDVYADPPRDCCRWSVVLDEMTHEEHAEHCRMAGVLNLRVGAP